MNIRTNKVTNFIFPMSKIENALFDQRTNRVFYENSLVQVSTGADKSPAVVDVTIDFNGVKSQGHEMPEFNRLKNYDREIHDAIASLYDAGNHYISSRMIANVLSGCKNRRITAESHARILSSINKMRCTELTIDASREAESFKINNYQYSGSLLPFTVVSDAVMNNNKVQDCINLSGGFPLLEYAKLRKQLASADVNLFGSMSTRQLHVEMKGYLCRQVLWMKHAKNRKRVIRYETLQDYLCLKVLDSHKRKEVREDVAECLEYWKKLSFIKGYVERKEDRKFAKVEIIL